MHEENKKSLTLKRKCGKLSKKELEIKNRSLTGKILLEVNCYQGGVTDIIEYKKMTETISE